MSVDSENNDAPSNSRVLAVERETMRVEYSMAEIVKKARSNSTQDRKRLDMVELAFSALTVTYSFENFNILSDNTTQIIHDNT